MKEKIALLLGASGSVGFELMQALLDHSAYQKVIAYIRRPLDQGRISSSGKLVQKIIPEMTPARLHEAVSESLASFSSDHQEPAFMGFSALGVGAKTAALTIDQHRAIDVDLNQSFAQALAVSPKIEFLALLSAMGANPNAKTTGSGAAGMARYARVKGEAEEAVRRHGPKIVALFRPAMIRGSQHTPRVLDMAAPIFDWLIPQRYHSISTRQLAQAMVAASLIPQKSPGIYTYPEMMKLVGREK